MSFVQCLVVLSLVTIVLLTEPALATKSADKKLMPKKASSAKPTKGPKTLLDRFPHLSGDDIGFIKALDKQFTKYGGAVKIKVVNGTLAADGKNKKRTINGDVGYGYYGQQQAAEQSYSFSKPKFQIYPYSQHDIPALPSYQRQQAHDHFYHSQNHEQQQPQHYQSQGEERTVPHSVQIQPSVSFELTHTDQGYEKVQPQQPHAVEHSVPVIVLRIPGPQKYAAHLQQLLQQYLEIRAAEYIKSLQEQEYHYQQQQQQQQHQSEPENQQNYQQTYSHQQSVQETQPEHQSNAQPSYADYEDHEQQYQAYQVQQHEPESNAEEENSHASQQQEDSYTPQQYQHQSPAVHQQYGPPPQHEPSTSPVHENHPGKLHTQVIFTGHGNYASQTTASLKHRGYEGYDQPAQQQQQYVTVPQYMSHQAVQAQAQDYYEQPENEAPQQVQYHQSQSVVETAEQEPQQPYAYHYETQAAVVHSDAESVPEHQQVQDEEPAAYVHRHLAMNQRSTSVEHEHKHSSYDRPHNHHAHGQHPVSEARKMMSRY